MDDERLVDFHMYCKTCKYYETDEGTDPCNECLNNPVNIDSHKPVNYSQKDQAS